jgi:proline dehydrogenase
VQSLKTYLRRTASSCLMPLAERAARAYIAGPELADAMRLTRELAERGFQATIGFWDGPEDAPREVADHYLAALDALAAAPEAYLSIKLPALRGSQQLLGEVLARARELRVPIHFDSHGTDSADEMWAAAVQASTDAALDVRCSVPGRWRRSLDDVEAAISNGIAVRVIKGQWPDPDCAELDMREGCLQVIDRLAGRARHVAVASHDAWLAGESLRRLKAAGTPCQLELLYGLPEREALEVAAEEQISARYYVPYGKAYLPYCLAQARRQPRLIWWLLRDSLMSAVTPSRR